MAPATLRVTDFRDREFLAACLDAADGDGWFDSRAVAEQLGLKGVTNRHVSNRCSWLWRYGVLEREHLVDQHGNLIYVAGDPGRPKWGQRWHLTELGERYLSKHLLAHQRKTLTQVEDMRLLDLTSLFADQLVGAPDVARNLMLRELRYRTFGVKANSNLKGG